MSRETAAELMALAERLMRESDAVRARAFERGQAAITSGAALSTGALADLERAVGHADGLRAAATILRNRALLSGRAEPRATT